MIVWPHLIARLDSGLDSIINWRQNLCCNDVS